MRRRIQLLTVLLLVAGCGGKVVLDSASAHGAGGGPTTASANGAGGASTASAGGEGASVSVGAGGGGGSPINAPVECTAFCSTLDQPACPKGDDCLARCADMYAHGCQVELEAMLACIPPWVTDTCTIINIPPDGSPGCLQQINAYENCMVLDNDPIYCLELGGVPAGDGCVGHAHHCDLTQFDLGSDDDLEIACDGTSACTCSINGMVVGTCTNLLKDEACFMPASCCRTSFGLL